PASSITKILPLLPVTFFKDKNKTRFNTVRKSSAVENSLLISKSNFNEDKDSTDSFADSVIIIIEKSIAQELKRKYLQQFPRI
ncbi:MAG: hypothetical protein N2D54_01585, partial [Chloroflexota bacterium]